MQAPSEGKTMRSGSRGGGTVVGWDAMALYAYGAGVLV